MKSPRVDLDFTGKVDDPKTGLLFNMLGRFAETRLLPLLKDGVVSFERLYQLMAPALHDPSAVAIIAVIQQLVMNFVIATDDPAISERFVEVLRVSREQVLCHKAKTTTQTQVEWTS